MADTAVAPVAVPVDVAALPRATTVQFLLLVATLLATGLFVGTAVHNATGAGEAYTALVRECLNASVTTPGGPQAQQAAELVCAAPAERRLAAYELVTALVVAVLGLVVVLVAPAVITRTRRLGPLRPGDGEAAQRVARLAAELGLRRPPDLVRGSLALREPFCFGRPGRYRIAMPRALLLRSGAPVFDPVARHELAHLAHRDVALSWLARGVWYALGPLLLAPVVLGLARGEVSVLPDYLWRAAVLAAVVVAVQRSLLRAREHDADLAAAWAGGSAALEAVLAGDRRPPPSRPARLLGHHPTTARRLAVLHDPVRAGTVGFLDGAVPALLATLTFPIVVRLLVGLGFGDPALAGWVPVVAAALVGPLLGATVGLGLWRQALLARTVDARPRVAPAAAGVFVGAVVGQVVSLAGTAVPGIGGFAEPLLVLVAAVAFAGAAVVTAGLGAAWADVAAWLPRPLGVAVPAVLLGGLLFAVATWAAQLVAFGLDAGGWTLGGMVVVLELTQLPLAVVALVLAALVAALVVGGRTPVTPAWLLPPGAQQWWRSAGPRPGLVVGVGVVAGLAAALVLVVSRVLNGPPADDLARWQRGVALFLLLAAVGVVAIVVLGLAHGSRGVGAGLLAGPVGVLTAAAGYAVLNAVHGGSPGTDFLGTAQVGLALALVAQLAAGWIALPGRPGLLPAVPAVALAAMCTVAGGTALVAGQAVLAPPLDQVFPAAAGVVDYRDRVGPQLFVRRSEILMAVRTIVADVSLTPAEVAARVRAEGLEPTRRLLADAQAYQPPGPPLTEIHAQGVSAFRHAVAGYELFVRWLETQDASLVPAIQAEVAQETTERQAWVAAFTALPG